MTLDIKQNIPLAPLTTFGIGGDAKFFVEVGSIEELKEAVEFAKDRALPIFVLGGGSNILVSDDGFDGLVVKMNPVRGKSRLGGTADHAFQAGRTSNGMNIRGISSLNTPTGWRIQAGAGETWDDVVSYAVGLNAGGLENLSLIPGTVGGAVYQNIGAYGVEIKDVLASVRAYDVKTGKVVEFSNEECCFEYRSSVFKKKKDLIIIEAKLVLSENHAPNLSYPDLQKRLGGAKSPTISEVRQAVIETRRNKLPYPDEISNAGSFFKNPVIPTTNYQLLVTKYPDLKGRELGNGFVKLSAAQLIEKCGFKGKRFGNIGVSDKHSLVLVNYGNGAAKELGELEAMIKTVVRVKFGVYLEPEVEKVA